MVGKPPAFDPADVLPKAKPIDAVTAPSLAAPAKVDRQTKLPAGAWPLHTLTADPTDTRFALCDGHTLHAGDAATGEVAWSVRLDPPAEYTHAAFLANGRLIAVGPHGVTAVSPAGVAKWGYRVPETDPRPELSSPVFAGNRLVLRLGEHALLALDTLTGKPAWVKDAAGRSRFAGVGFDGAPKFGRHLAAGPTGLVVYSRRRAVAPEPGRRVDPRESAAVVARRMGRPAGDPSRNGPGCRRPHRRVVGGSGGPERRVRPLAVRRRSTGQRHRHPAGPHVRRRLPAWLSFGTTAPTCTG